MKIEVYGPPSKRNPTESPSSGSELYRDVSTGHLMVWHAGDDAAVDLESGGGGATLSNDTPADLGTAAPGVSTEASRSDHVHSFSPIVTYVVTTLTAYDAALKADLAAGTVPVAWTGITGHPTDLAGYGITDALSTTTAWSGDLGGTGASPTVTRARGLRETAGPTTLTMNAVADGQVLVRSGTTIVGLTLAAMMAVTPEYSTVTQLGAPEVSSGTIGGP